ncbi:hypothetical protein BOX15_Mlig025389g1 [Macrostomum lignano]|uniref:Uncharacterized protein n=1 Tax=Macrostomum lignano TaxID=282301 RepID=A0A267GZQ8_9PLAT|nr:hypothetical protein BOX15_Mlig025389g1 [Macrostomum lignano]
MGLKKRHSPMPTDSSRIFSSQSARHCESAYSYCSCFTSNCYGTTGAYVDSSDEPSYEYLNQCASNRSTYQFDRSRQREPRLSQQLSTVSANNRQCHQGPVVSMLQCLHPTENRRTQSYDSFSSGRRRQSRQMHPRGHSRPSAQQRVQDCVGGSQTAVQIVFDSDCSRSPMCCVLKRDGEESSSEEESTEDCSGFPHKPYCFDESSDNEECDERSDGLMYREVDRQDGRSTTTCDCCYYCSCCCSRQRDQPMEQRRHPPTMLIRRDQRVMTARSRGECAGRVGKGSLVDCRTNCYEASVCHTRRMTCVSDCPGELQQPRHRHQVDVYATCCHPDDSVAYMERNEPVDKSRRSRRYSLQQQQQEQLQDQQQQQQQQEQDYLRRQRHEGFDRSRRRSGDLESAAPRPMFNAPWQLHQQLPGNKLRPETDNFPGAQRAGSLPNDYKRRGNYLPRDYAAAADANEGQWTNGTLADKHGPRDQFKAPTDYDRQSGQFRTGEKYGKYGSSFENWRTDTKYNKIPESQPQTGALPYDRNKAQPDYLNDRFKGTKLDPDGEKHPDRYYQRGSLGQHDRLSSKTSQKYDDVADFDKAGMPDPLRDNELVEQYGGWTDKVSVGKYSGRAEGKFADLVTDPSQGKEWNYEQWSERPSANKLGYSTEYDYRYSKLGEPNVTKRGLKRRSSLRDKSDKLPMGYIDGHEPRTDSSYGTDKYLDSTTKAGHEKDRDDKLFIDKGRDGSTEKKDHKQVYGKIPKINEEDGVHSKEPAKEIATDLALAENPRKISEEDRPVGNAQDSVQSAPDVGPKPKPVDDNVQPSSEVDSAPITKNVPVPPTDSAAEVSRPTTENQELTEDKSRDALPSDSDEYQRIEAPSDGQQGKSQQLSQQETIFDSLEGAGQTQLHKRPQRDDVAESKASDSRAEAAAAEESADKVNDGENLDLQSPKSDTKQAKPMETSGESKTSAADDVMQRDVEEKLALENQGTDHKPKVSANEFDKLPSKFSTGTESTHSKKLGEGNFGLDDRGIPQEKVNKDSAQRSQQPDTSPESEHLRRTDTQPAPTQETTQQLETATNITEDVPEDAGKLAKQPPDGDEPHPSRAVVDKPVDNESKPPQSSIPAGSGPTPAKIYYPPGAEQRRRSQMLDAAVSPTGIPPGTCERPLLPPGAIVEKSPDTDDRLKQHRGSVTSETCGPIYPPGAVGNRPSQLSIGSDGSRRPSIAGKRDGFNKIAQMKPGYSGTEQRRSSIAEKSFKAAEKGSSTCFENGKASSTADVRSIPVIREDNDAFTAALQFNKTSQESYQRYNSLKFESEGGTLTIEKSEYVSRRSRTESFTDYQNEQTALRSPFADAGAAAQEQQLSLHKNELDGSEEPYVSSRPNSYSFSRFYGRPNSIFDNKESMTIESGSRPHSQLETTATDIGQGTAQVEKLPNESVMDSKSLGYKQIQYAHETMPGSYQLGSGAQDQTTPENHPGQQVYDRQNLGYQPSHYFKDSAPYVYEKSEKSIPSNQPASESDPISQKYAAKTVLETGVPMTEKLEYQTDNSVSGAGSGNDPAAKGEYQTEQLVKRTSKIYKPELSLSELKKTSAGIAASVVSRPEHGHEIAVNVNKIGLQPAQQLSQDYSETTPAKSQNLADGSTGYIPENDALKNKSIQQPAQQAQENRQDYQQIEPTEDYQLQGQATGGSELDTKLKVGNVPGYQPAVSTPARADYQTAPEYKNVTETNERPEKQQETTEIDARTELEPSTTPDESPGSQPAIPFDKRLEYQTDATSGEGHKYKLGEASAGKPADNSGAAAVDEIERFQPRTGYQSDVTAVGRPEYQPDATTEGRPDFQSESGVHRPAIIPDERPGYQSSDSKLETQRSAPSQSGLGYQPMAETPETRSELQPEATPDGRPEYNHTIPPDGKSAYQPDATTPDGRPFYQPSATDFKGAPSATALDERPGYRKVAETEGKLPQISITSPDGRTEYQPAATFEEKAPHHEHAASITDRSQEFQPDQQLSDSGPESQPATSMLDDGTKYQPQLQKIESGPDNLPASSSEYAPAQATYGNEPGQQEAFQTSLDKNPNYQSKQLKQNGHTGYQPADNIDKVDKPVYSESDNQSDKFTNQLAEKNLPSDDTSQPDKHGIVRSESEPQQKGLSSISEERLSTPGTVSKDQFETKAVSDSRWGTPSAAEVQAPAMEGYSHRTGGTDSGVVPAISVSLARPEDQKAEINTESDSKDALQRSTATIDSSATGSRDEQLGEQLVSSDSRTIFPTSSDSRTEVVQSSEYKTPVPTSTGVKTGGQTSSEAMPVQSVRTNQTAGRETPNSFSSEANEHTGSHGTDPPTGADGRTSLTSVLDSKTGLPTENSRAGLPTADHRAGLQSDGENKTDLPTLVDDRTGLPTQVDSRTDQASAVDSKPGIPTAMDGRTGQPSGEDSRTVQPTGVDGRTGQPSGVDGRTGQPSGVDSRTGQPTGVDGRTGVDGNRTVQPADVDSRTGRGRQDWSSTSSGQRDWSSTSSGQQDWSSTSSGQQDWSSTSSGQQDWSSTSSGQQDWSSSSSG